MSDLDRWGNAIPDNASADYRAMVGGNTQPQQAYSSLSDMYTHQAAQATAPMGSAAAPATGGSPQPTTGASANAGGWDFSNGGLTQQEGIKAPTYSSAGATYNPITQDYLMTGAIDPALQMTLGAAGAGKFRSGVGAFLSPMGNNAFQGTNNSALGGSSYADTDMNDLAKKFGLDSGGRSGLDLQSYLNDQLKDYASIQGMSQGWNPTNDARGANATIYRNVNGQFVPVQTQGYHAREQGSYVQENPGVLAPFAVLGAGLAAGAAGGAAAGSGGAASGAGAAGGTAGAAGSSSGWLGSLANYAGLGSQYGALPGYAQAGLQGAVQGAATSGISGGNPLQGALLGGLGGGLSPVVNSGLSGLGGLPSYATNALGSAGVGALTTGLSGGNPLVGAVGAGVGSGVGGGLNYAGVNGGISSILGRLAGSTASGLASGRDLSSIFTPQQIAMLAANPNTLRALFK